jgi:hypothetical protein
MYLSWRGRVMLAPGNRVVQDLIRRRDFLKHFLGQKFRLFALAILVGVVLQCLSHTRKK